MRTRKGLVGGFGALAGSALIAGAAWACVPQASLSANPSSGGVGSTVTLTGGTYDAAGGPVSIYWDSPSGAPIATTTVGTAAGVRNISVQITVPADATSGSHIIYATQNDANGQAIPGSPVRAVFRVTDGATPAPAPVNPQGTAPESQGAAGLAPAPAETPAPAPAQVAPAPASQPASQDSGTSGWVVVGLAVLALGLFAIGTGIFLTERKRSRARG